MIDLAKIPATLLENRGAYSTVNSAYKDQLVAMQKLTGQLSSFASAILYRVQPKEGDPQSVKELIESARTTLDELDACADAIVSLHAQKKQIHPMAWPK
jgi:hypothetical protein